MTDYNKLWENILAEIELTVSKANFSTWFKDTYILREEEGTVYLGVPNAFAKDWLQSKYHNAILKSLRTLSEHIRALEYTICKDDGRRRDTEHNRSQIPSMNRELPLSDYYINKEDNLNPKYTFDSFIVGGFNELAHAAAQAVVKKPGGIYNPFFIYGHTGHGKTHLIQAIGNQIKTLHPGKKVYYMPSEKFAVDFINSVQTQKVNQFKEKYRKYDCLIMDDIQFFSNTEKTQEELFHLFNNFYDSNKQIVFSSDKHPNYIPNLEERLKSRFGAGMIVDIPAPDQESRGQIIKAKAEQNNFTLSQETVDYLASSVDSNIRELEGVINSIICQSQLKGKELSVLEIKNLIKNSVKPKKSVSVKDVIKTIANFYNIEEDSIYDKTRRKEVVKPRQLIMYILREDFNISYPSIGDKLGGRDHTTVIHSCGKIKDELRVNNVLVQELSQIRGMIC
ncbi:MAG TPA: chromosomal replication initiator protein DnaA [Candidatus Paceibacterota bacterium]